jgi:hypothetical protein
MNYSDVAKTLENFVEGRGELTCPRKTLPFEAGVLS